MAKVKVFLSIGFPSAVQESVIDVDDRELMECDTEEKKEELIQECWQEWANNYIEGRYELEED